MSYILIGVIILLVILLLFGPIFKLTCIIWKLLYRIHLCKRVDLRIKYGDWAGKKFYYLINILFLKVYLNIRTK